MKHRKQKEYELLSLLPLKVFSNPLSAAETPQKTLALRRDSLPGYQITTECYFELKSADDPVPGSDTASQLVPSHVGVQGSVETVVEFSGSIHSLKILLPLLPLSD
jgi:hypothetical protein